jgi:hypothetical protein
VIAFLSLSEKVTRPNCTWCCLEVAVFSSEHGARSWVKSFAYTGAWGRVSWVVAPFPWFVGAWFVSSKLTLLTNGGVVLLVVHGSWVSVILPASVVQNIWLVSPICAPRHFVFESMVQSPLVGGPHFWFPPPSGGAFSFLQQLQKFFSFCALLLSPYRLYACYHCLSLVWYSIEFGKIPRRW